MGVSPYLHVGPDRIYNPLTDTTLRAGEPGYAALRAQLEGAASRPSESLADGGWLVGPGQDISRAAASRSSTSR